MFSFLDIIKLPFRKERELFSSLHDILGFYPSDIDIYKTALIHRSVAFRNPKGINNERLEFLGDAVLDAIVADIVYKHFPNKKEGFLTEAKSKIVKRESLGKIADDIGLIRLIRNANHNQNHNSYMGGNALEALIGAIYLDKGYRHCMKFIKRRIIDNLLNIDKVAYKEVNFKSKLIEWTQKGRILLEYQLVSEEKEGNDSSPVFIFDIYLEGIKAGTGRGYTKREAQQVASKQALTNIKKDEAFRVSVLQAKENREEQGGEVVVGRPIYRETGV